MPRFAIFGLVLPICLLAQLVADPLLSELNRVLSANDAAGLHAVEQKLLTGSKNLDTLLSAGILLAQHDKFTEASALFERCSQEYPQSFEAKYNLALAQYALSNFAKALDALHNIAPQSARETAAVEYLEGKVFAATNRLHEAQQTLESAYRADPEEENYALDLGLLDIRSSAYVPAIAILQQALAQHPQWQELKLELSLASALAGRYKEAIALSRSLLHDNASPATARLITAFTLCMDEQYEACKNEAAAGLSSPNPDPYLYYLHAKALSKSDSTGSRPILGDLDIAIARMPACKVCILLRSRVLESNNDNRAAIADLQTLVQQDSKQAAAWYRLAVLYRKTGRSAEASDALHHYRTLQDNQETQEVESFRNQLMPAITSSPH